MKDIMVKDKMFNTWVNIVVGDMKLFNKYMKKHNKELQEPHQSVRGRTTMVGPGSAFIYLKTKNTHVLAHELLHFVIRAMQGRGFGITEDGEEAYCYCLEYYMKEVMKKW